MECKYEQIEREKRQNQELIDTLWNVNDGTTWMDWGNSSELIDTLWNVNVKKVSDSDDLNWN